MKFFEKTRNRRDTNPLLNLIWLILLLPVALILYVLWQERVPWLEEEYSGEGHRRGSRGDPGSRQPRPEKVPASKETAQGPAARQAEDRPSPDRKRQKDTSKAEHQPNRSQNRGDQLEVVEGIGPKTAEILRNAGIRSYRQLADTSVERLNEILREAGIRINPPDTWPEQARLAADGNWDGLDQLKGRLHAGRLDTD